MAYPGGKGAAGVHQAIINNIPPHEVYIESHLGGGYIMQRKKPAALSYGLDLDPAVIEAWVDRNIPRLVLHCLDAADFLECYPYQGDEFVYVDPPYVKAARRGGDLYRYEYTDSDHRRLIDVLVKLPCPVMVSGYQSDLYDDSPLAGWRIERFNAMTRRGVAEEMIWMNYPPPAALHDLRYLGANFRERERIKRKKTRWKARLERLDPLERQAIMECLRDLETAPGTPETAMLESPWQSVEG